MLECKRCDGAARHRGRARPRDRLIRAGLVLCLLLAAALCAPLWVDGAVPVCGAGRTCPDSPAPGVREVAARLQLEKAPEDHHDLM